MATWNGKKLRALRKDYDETGGEFCARLGVSVVTYRYWEQGRGAVPPMAQILLSRLEEDLRQGNKREVATA